MRSVWVLECSHSNGIQRTRPRIEMDEVRTVSVVRFEKHRNGIEKTSETVVEYSNGACSNSNEVPKYYVQVINRTSLNP